MPLLSGLSRGSPDQSHVRFNFIEGSHSIGKVLAWPAFDAQLMCSRASSWSEVISGTGGFHSQMAHSEPTTHCKAIRMHRANKSSHGSLSFPPRTW